MPLWKPPHSRRPKTRSTLYYQSSQPTDKAMTEQQLIFLREQLQEDLCSWAEVNDLPEFVQEDLCDIVVDCFVKAADHK